MIRYLYTLQTKHHKSSFPITILSYVINRKVLLTVVTMLYITFPLLIYFMTRGLCLLIPVSHFAHPPIPLLSADHQAVLCFCQFDLFCFVCWLDLFFKFHIYVKSQGICLSLPHLYQHNPLKVQPYKISFFYGRVVSIVCVRICVYIHTHSTSSESFHPSMDILVVFILIS